METEFKEIKGHKKFKIKNLFHEQNGVIGQGDIAIIEPGGGGPFPSHTHNHGHLFVVLEGTIDITINEDLFTVSENESFKVPGKVNHTMTNNSNSTSRILGIKLN